MDHRIDWLGALMLSTGLVPLLLVAEQGRDWGWSSSSALTCYVIGATALVLFVLQERRMGREALLPLSLFANPTVRVASIASVLLGMAMFGGLALLPLYLQIVKGATPTEAGLLLLPMTLGIMVGSITAGQAISRTGRYRIFPIVGSGLLAVALLGLHWIGADTPLWITMALMMLFGLGLGGNLQPLTLAVQNAVPAHMIGVATSSATFTRQMGGTIGTALFLTVLFGQVPDKITQSFQSVASTPAFQQALAQPANASFAEQFGSGPSGGTQASNAVLTDSSFLSTLDPTLARPFLVGFSEAMDVVFLLAAGVALVCFLVMLALPEVTLRAGSAYDERADADADAGELAQTSSTTESPERTRARGRHRVTAASS